MKRIFTQIVYITLLFASTIGVSAQNQWEALGGPAGGQVQRLYGTGTTLFMKSNDQSYFKSTNAGATWAALDMPAQWIYDLALDPILTNKVYALDYSRLFVSENNGTSWTTVSNGKFYGVFRMTISKQGVIFVYGWNGIYASVDGGENWNQVLTGLEVRELVTNDAGDAFYSTIFYNNSTFDYESTIYKIPYPGVGNPYTLDQNEFSFQEVDTDFMSLVNFGANASNGRIRIGSFAGTASVELRFGPSVGQKAHRFLVPEGATSGVLASEFTYADYVDVPFEAWDVTNNRQLNISFRDQGRNGFFDLITENFDGAAIEQSREYIYISDSDYNADEPNANMTSNGGHQHRIMYDFWPVLTSGFTWDPDNLPESYLTFSYDNIEGTTSINALINPKQYYADNNLDIWSNPWGYKLVIDANNNIILLDERYVLGSSDNGATWQGLRDGDLNTFYNYGTLTTTPNGRTYLFNNYDRQIYYRTSFANPWVKVADKWPTLNGSQVTLEFVLSIDNTTIIAGSGNLGPFKTTNAATGLDWVQSNTGMNALFGDNLIVTDNGRVIYHKRGLIGYYFSDNNGANWTFRNLVVDFPSLGNAVENIFKISNGKIFLTAYNKIYTSIDNADTWQILLDDLGNENHARHYENMYVLDDNTFYMTGYHFYPTDKHVVAKTEDQGVTWTVVDLAGLPANYGTWYPLSIAANNDGNVVFGLYNYNEGQYQIWKGVAGVASKITMPGQNDSYFYPQGLFTQGGNKFFVSNGQAIFTSEDSGNTWVRTNFSNNRIINLGDGYAVSRDKVFQVTQDGGKTWKNTSLERGYITAVGKNADGVYFAASSNSAYKFTQDLIVDPSELPPFIDFNWTAQSGPQAGTFNSMAKFSDGKLMGALNNATLRKSDGFDQAFTQITNAAFSEVYPASVFVDSNDKIFILARSTADNLNYIFTSADGGVNWTRADAVYPGSNQGHIFRKDKDGNLLGAGGGNTTTQGLFFSTDDGNSWIRKFSDFLLRYATDEEGNYFACYPYFESNNIGYGLMRSTDGGETWEEINNGIPSRFSLNIVVDIEGNLLTHDNYSVYKSTDKGDTWMDITPQMTGQYFWTQEQFVISPENHYYFFNTNATTSVSSAGRRLYKSTNGGASWFQVPNGHPETGTIGGGFFVDNTLVVRVSDVGLQYADPNNIQWSSNSQGLLVLNQDRILKLDSRLFVSTSNNLYKSDDKGETWSGLGLPVNLFLKISETEAIAYGSSFIYKTTDGGITWSSVVNRFLRSIAYNGSLYYGTDGSDIYFSADLITWTNFNIIGLPQDRFIEQVGIDSESRLYYKVYDYSVQQYALYQLLFGSPVPVSIIADGWAIGEMFYRDGKLFVFARTGNLFSTADGFNWQNTVTPSGNRIVLAQNDQYYFILSGQGVVWLSRDQGQTWQNVSSSNTTLSFNDVVINDYDGRAVAAVTNGTVQKSANVILPDDGEPPVMEILYPQNANAPIKPQLSITFDEVIEVVDGKQLRLVKVGPPEQTIEFINAGTGIVDGKTVTFEINETLEFQNTYYIIAEAGSFTDLFGNPSAAIASTSTWRFTTIAQPQVVSLNPVNNANNQSLRPFFDVTFDKSVSGVAGKFLRIYDESDQGTPVLSHEASSSLLGGNTITFAPFAFDDNRTITISPISTANDIPVTITFNAAGTPLEGLDKMYLFGGAMIVDHDVATGEHWDYVVGNWGVDDGIGQMTAVPGEPDKWTFTYSPDLRTYFDIDESEQIYWLSFVFSNASGTLQTAPNYYAKLGDQSFAIAAEFDVESLDFSKTYIIKFDDESFSAGGDNRFSALNNFTSWEINTRPQPEVSSLLPAHNASNIELNPQVSITFAEPVTMVDGKMIRVYGSDDPGTVIFEIDAANVSVSGNSISFEIDQLLDFNTEYFVQFEALSFRAEGRAFSTISTTEAWKFVTREKPAIASTLPTNNVSGVPLLSEISITFEEPVSLVEGPKMGVYESSNPIDAVVIFDVVDGVISGNTITYTLSGPLDFSTDYFVRFDENSFSAFGRVFSALNTNTELNFNTRALPAISSTAPVHQSSGVNLMPNISITFEEPVTLVDGPQMGVYESANPSDVVAIFNVIDGVVTGNTITYTLSGPLNFSTDYFVRFDENAFSAFGREFSRLTGDNELVFTTRAIPAIASRTPVNNASDVGISSAVSIVFAEVVGMDPDKSVRVYSASDEATPVYILPLSTANQTGNTIQLAADLTFEYDKEYLIRVDEAAFQVEGMAFSVLTSGDNWKFTTIAAPDEQAPTITAPPSTPNLDAGASNRVINFTINDNVAVTQANFFYRGIVTNSNVTFTELPMNATPAGSNTFTAELPANAYDVLGVEFYVTAADAAGNASRSPSTTTQFHYSYKTLPSTGADAPSISGLPGGGTVTGYRIRAVSYELVNTNFLNVLGLNAYNKSVIRIFKVPAGTSSTATNPYQELNTSGFTGVQRGEGYFINSKDASAFLIQNSSTPKNNRNSLFSFTLKPGWNMIGNPYPLTIDWNNIRTGNNNIGALNTYDGNWGSSQSSMATNTGGLVFVSGSADINLQVPIPGISTGGRIDNIQPGSRLDNVYWELPITLQQGDIKNELPGIGMHPEANELFDRFDNPTLPRFFDYAEINFARDEPMAPYFTKDVVPTQSEYVWEFSVASNQEGLATISWDNSDLGSAKDLVLFDVSKQLIVDMKAKSSYTFDPKNSSSFRIHFGDNLGESLKPDYVMLGNIYPNPSQGEAIVPFAISAETGEAAILMELYNNLGVKVGTLVDGKFEPGFHEAPIDAKSRGLSNGMYLIKLSVAGEKLRETHYTKWVLNK